MFRKILFAAVPLTVIAAAALAFTTTSAAVPVGQVKVGAESSPQLAFMNGHGSHGSSFGSHGGSYSSHNSYRGYGSYGSYGSYRGSYGSYGSYHGYSGYRSWNSYNSYRDYRGSFEHGGMSDR
jgi:hypothetical protein